jgi:hypothetical protein
MSLCDPRHMIETSQVWHISYDMQDRPAFLLLCLVLIAGLGSGLGSGLDGFGSGLERGSDAAAGEQLARVGIEREGDIPLPAHG